MTLITAAFDLGGPVPEPWEFVLAVLAYWDTELKIYIISSTFAFSAAASQIIFLRSRLTRPQWKKAGFFSKVPIIERYTSHHQADAASAGWSESSSPEESPWKQNMVHDD